MSCAAPFRGAPRRQREWQQLSERETWSVGRRCGPPGVWPRRACQVTHGVSGERGQDPKLHRRGVHSEGFRAECAFVRRPQGTREIACQVRHERVGTGDGLASRVRGFEVFDRGICLFHESSSFGDTATEGRHHGAKGERLPEPILIMRGSSSGKERGAEGLDLHPLTTGVRQHGLPLGNRIFVRDDPEGLDEARRVSQILLRLTENGPG